MEYSASSFDPTSKWWPLFLTALWIALLIGSLIFFYRMLDEPPVIEFIVDTTSVQTLENLTVEVIFTDDRGLSGRLEASIVGGPTFTETDWRGKSGAYRFQLAGFARSPINKEFFEKLKETKSFIFQATIGDTAGQKTTNQMLILNLNSKTQ